MKVNIITSLPEFFTVTDLSIFGRAKTNNLINLNIVNIKEYGKGLYKSIDDTPYGGGGGMILRPDIIEKTIETNNLQKTKIFLTSPRGTKFNQKKAFEIVKFQEITILCNRFEGVDQRAIEYYQMEEISIGDYILFGGEVACLAILESVCRLIPNVLENAEIIKNESFSDNFAGQLEYDHYTKPSIWKEKTVPYVLQSGNHLNIDKWKKANLKSLKS